MSSDQVYWRRVVGIECSGAVRGSRAARDRSPCSQHHRSRVAGRSARQTPVGRSPCGSVRRRAPVTPRRAVRPEVVRDWQLRGVAHRLRRRRLGAGTCCRRRTPVGLGRTTMMDSGRARTRSSRRRPGCRTRAREVSAARPQRSTRAHELGRQIALFGISPVPRSGSGSFPVGVDGSFDGHAANRNHARP